MTGSESNTPNTSHLPEIQREPDMFIEPNGRLSPAEVKEAVLRFAQNQEPPYTYSMLLEYRTGSNLFGVSLEWMMWFVQHRTAALDGTSVSDQESNQDQITESVADSAYEALEDMAGRTPLRMAAASLSQTVDLDVSLRATPESDESDREEPALAVPTVDAKPALKRPRRTAPVAADPEPTPRSVPEQQSYSPLPRGMRIGNKEDVSPEDRRFLQQAQIMREFIEARGGRAAIRRALVRRLAHGAMNETQAEGYIDQAVDKGVLVEIADGVYKLPG